MDDFDEFDDEYDDDDDFDEEEDELDEREDELLDHEDELLDREDELRDKADDIEDGIRDNVQEGIDDLHGKRVAIEDIQSELEEIKRMKDDLRNEIESVHRERERFSDYRRAHGNAGSRYAKFPKPPKPPKPSKPPRAPRRAAVVDFSDLTDSLDDMMEGLGDQIRMSLSGLKDIGREFKDPYIKLKTSGKHAKRRSHDTEIDLIPPERVASVITPLASEERLKIMDFLKSGGKTFNELETHTGKTGSSLTHHLNPMIEAGYVIKGEVRGTYYLTVEGRLAYRLAQWLTDRLEHEIRLKDIKGAKKNGAQDGEVSITVEDEEEDDEQ